MCSPTAGGLTNQGKNKERVEEAWDSHALDRRSQDFLLLQYSSQSLLKQKTRKPYPISPPLETLSYQSSIRNPILSVLH